MKVDLLALVGLGPDLPVPPAAPEPGPEPDPELDPELEPEPKPDVPLLDPKPPDGTAVPLATTPVPLAKTPVPVAVDWDLVAEAKVDGDDDEDEEDDEEVVLHIDPLATNQVLHCGT